MTRTYTPCILLFAFALLMQIVASGQVTAVYSDYGGYWTTSNTSMNSVKPDNNHNLLAFTWNGTTYSTGVNDATLTSHSVTFTPCSFRAFPVTTVPNTASGFYFVMLGQKYDGIDNGVDNSASTPFPANPSGAVLASFLTDGVKGLNLGTGLANIPAGSVLRFDLSANGLTASAINDGIPDIFVTEEASPSSSSPDYFKFVDASGNTVGNVVSVTTSSLPQIGNWQADFYNLNSTQTDGTFINQPRPLAFYAADLGAFGITASNYRNAVAFVYQPNGTSDPAFIAFNEPSVSISTQLTLTSQPANYTGSVALSPAPKVQLRDGLGQSILQAGIPVTASVRSGSATLSGTLTVNTDANGIATFTNLIIAGSGTITLSFSSTSLNSAVTGNITSSALPLDWISFTGKRSDNVIYLSWETTNEVLTRDFLVQRSKDGIDWKKIDSVKVNTASTENTHRYSYTDARPVPGTNYYRLLQRDLDGHSSFSTIVAVSQPVAGIPSFYPNPVTNGYCYLLLRERTTVRLFSGDGKLVREADLPAGTQTLDCHGLSKGSYTLQLGKTSFHLLLQ